MELTVRTTDGIELACEDSGDGPPVVLLHGLTATRRYVVMRSSVLERTGHRVIAYDARGHGRSAPAAHGSYGYESLAADLLAVLDARGVPRATLAGASMGAHTAIALALSYPERVAALGVITPAFDPGAEPSPATVDRWRSLARGLRDGGVDGFLAAYDFARVPGEWRAVVRRAVGQRLAAHEHPDAVADALEAVPLSRPFTAIDELGRLSVPTVVVASRDQADPDHPLAVAERYVQAIPGATLVVEDPPPPLRSPIAWQGGRLSRVLASLVARADTHERADCGCRGGPSLAPAEP